MLYIESTAALTKRALLYGDCVSEMSSIQEVKHDLAKARVSYKSDVTQVNQLISTIHSDIKGE